jgi:hypothetical protein
MEFVQIADQTPDYEDEDADEDGLEVFAEYATNRQAASDAHENEIIDDV